MFEFSASHPCVVFVDELEGMAAERTTPHEVGEMKRVTGTLLTRIETMPWQTLIVGATNHGEMLDRAAWRRFEVVLTLNPPS